MQQCIKKSKFIQQLSFKLRMKDWNINEKNDDEVTEK